MPRRVLIIDDEEDIREVAALSLETVAGWDVIVAGSGAAGIAKAREMCIRDSVTSMSIPRGKPSSAWTRPNSSR